MIISHDRVAIFGYPRSGTKLLAKILQDMGYHNHGEWFDTWTSRIDDSTSTRLSPEEQDANHLEQRTFPNRAAYRHTLDLLDRASKWHPMASRWCVTIWPENLSLYPFVASKLGVTAWLCPQRNHWDQLLSRIVVYQNQNPDGDRPSMPVHVDHAQLSRHYWTMHRVSAIQEDLIRNGGYRIPFDQLVAGTYDGFGQGYGVSTVDQHESIEDLISNLNEIKDWYQKLEHERLCMCDSTRQDRPKEVS